MLIFLALEVVDLDLDLANLFPLLFFVFTGILDILVTLTDLLFQLSNLVDLIVSHSKGSTVVRCLLEDLGD